MQRLKSNKVVKPFNQVLGKRKFIFPKEFADSNDPTTGKKCMMLSINQDTIYIPVGEPVDLDYNYWSLLKANGKIGKIVMVADDGTTKTTI